MILHQRQVPAGMIVAASHRMQGCSSVRRGFGDRTPGCTAATGTEAARAGTRFQRGGCTVVQPPPYPWSKKMDFESLKKLAQNALETAKDVAGKATASTLEGF